MLLWATHDSIQSNPTESSTGPSESGSQAEVHDLILRAREMTSWYLVVLTLDGDADKLSNILVNLHIIFLLSTLWAEKVEHHMMGL